MVAVVLALEESQVLSNAAGVKLTDVNGTAKFGDLTAFNREAPSLMAEVDYNQRAIQISIKDNRQDTRNASVKPTDEGGVTFARTGETAPSGTLTTSGTGTGTGDGIILDPNTRTYRVRWWAIPT